MSYADYANTVPSGIQALISVLLTAGISVLLVGIFHKQLIQLAQEPERAEDETGPYIPASYFLSGRIIQVTSIAFVFLFGFTVSQFVINARNADEATQLEAQYWSRSMMTAESIPAAAGGPDIVAALETYRTIVLQDEWPLMEQGNQLGTYDDQRRAATQLTAATSTAQDLGATETSGWDALTSSIDDLLTNGSNRISYVPSQSATNLIFAVILLGSVSLAMTAIYQPARRTINMVLIGIMGGVYGFMFYVVAELSNPYQGGGAIQSLLGFLS